MAGIDIENELALVMTASIDPKGMPAASSMPDPLRRESDYVNALSYYLANHPRVRRIVFAENSGWSLDGLKEAANKEARTTEIEFLSFQLNDFPRHLGKSYGEMLLLDHVFEQSRLIKSSHYVAKTTGRNFIYNLTALLETAPAPFEFYADLRDHPIYEWLGTGSSGHHGESRFFIVTPDFYKNHFRGKYAGLDDSKGDMVENLIYRVVKETLGPRKTVGRFKIEPDFRGIAGHFGGKNYGSAKERSKRAIRGATRKLIPWLWI